MSASRRLAAAVACAALALGAPAARAADGNGGTNGGNSGGNSGGAFPFQIPGFQPGGGAPQGGGFDGAQGSQGAPGDYSAHASSPQMDIGGATSSFVVVHALLSLIPGEVGGDLSLGPRATNGAGALRARIAWPFQIPLGFAGNAGSSEGRSAPLNNHRVVVAPEIVLAEQAGAAPPVLVTFQARAGYRFVFHPDGGPFGLVAGLGTTLQFHPLVRPSLSPEVGIRLGGCCRTPSYNFTLIVRGDVWFAGQDDMRLGVALGWVFF